MTVIHLTDAQRDTFAACGLIVIDGEPLDIACNCQLWRNGYRTEPHAATCRINSSWVAPEGWRILTEPCDTCHGSTVDVIDTGEAFRVRDCPNCVGGRRVVTLTAACPTCDGDVENLCETYGTNCVCGDCDQGVVTLGRFTIPALLPVVDETAEISPIKIASQRWTDDDLSAIAGIHPRPGTFIARPERVA